MFFIFIWSPFILQIFGGSNYWGLIFSILWKKTSLPSFLTGVVWSIVRKLVATLLLWWRDNSGHLLQSLFYFGIKIILGTSVRSRKGRSLSMRTCWSCGKLGRWRVKAIGVVSDEWRPWHHHGVAVDPVSTEVMTCIVWLLHNINYALNNKFSIDELNFILVTPQLRWSSESAKLLHKTFNRKQ